MGLMGETRVHGSPNLRLDGVWAPDWGFLLFWGFAACTGPSGDGGGGGGSGHPKPEGQRRTQPPNRSNTAGLTLT